MTIEQKIKEIEDVLVGFKHAAEIFNSEEDGYSYLTQALEVIKELQAKLNAAEYLDNSLQNIKKDANAYQELYAEQLAENAELKAQVDRVRDINWMRQFIIEHSSDSWNVADKIAKEQRNYILGGEGGK